MFRRLWGRFRDGNERHERLEEEAAVERAMQEREQKPRDGWSEADQMRPPGSGEAPWPPSGSF